MWKNIEKGARNVGRGARRGCLFHSFALSLFTSLLLATTLFAQSDVVYIENPYPGMGTMPSDVFADIPSTMLYPENGDGTASELPLSPTQRLSDVFFAKGQAPRREGMFQKVNVEALWAPAGKGAEAVGFTQLSLSATFALPAPSKESPLLLKPLFQTWFFDSDALRPTFCTTGLDLLWLVSLAKDKFTLALGATPSYSGDFKAKKETFRIPAHLVGIWTSNPRTKILLGVLYLDRTTSYNWLPMGGILWTPNEDLNFELTFPRIRLSQRIKWWGSVAGDSVSDWLYTSFEFGTGSWGYRFDLGSTDTRVEYSDYRWLFGYERRTLSGLTLALEVGWMFKREIALQGYGSFRPNDAFFLQLKTSY